MEKIKAVCKHQHDNGKVHKQILHEGNVRPNHRFDISWEAKGVRDTLNSLMEGEE